MRVASGMAETRSVDDVMDRRITHRSCPIRTLRAPSGCRRGGSILDIQKMLERRRKTACKVLRCEITKYSPRRSSRGEDMSSFIIWLPHWGKRTDKSILAALGSGVCSAHRPKNMFCKAAPFGCRGAMYQGPTLPEWTCTKRTAVYYSRPKSVKPQSSFLPTGLSVSSFQSTYSNSP